MTPERALPALTAETIRIADPGPLVSVLAEHSPLLWRRRGFGMAGFGEALRLTFSGANRMTDAAAAWRAIVADASVTDPLQIPGSGLVALGTFAFSAESSQSSVLIVPSIVVGRSGTDFWLTRISLSELPAAALPTPAPLGEPFGTELTPGRTSPANYLAAVRDAIGHIRAGKLSKVVIARDLVGTMPAGADQRPMILALADGYPDCWTFAIDGFLGASPETLVSVHGGSVTARVLAGSAARGVDANSDLEAASALATSTKDQDEHEFAVQNVLSSLRPHSPAVTASDTPFTLKLPNLWHLASDVEGILVDGSSSLDLLSSLHPTAAVAGTPTTEAIAVIDQLEPFDRGRYAGPVGWVGADGDGEWAIALRCAQVSEDGRVTAWAGAGIVADSDPDHELVETRMKFRPIVEAFAPPAD
ncbi:MAG: isochorismate synthase [Homoserinimonas sp.]